eukprot:5452449-Prorocentrum_lima.AAC.1
MAVGYYIPIYVQGPAGIGKSYATSSSLWNTALEKSRASASIGTPSNIQRNSRQHFEIAVEE